MKGLVIATFTAMSLFCFASCEIKEDRNGILEVMDNQVDAWNNGDIERYMTYYWKSDSLMFIGGNRITYGYEASLSNYKKAFPTKEKMGQLSFDILVVDFVTSDYASVTGKWQLSYPHSAELKERGGVFSLTFRKVKDQWVIVKDHTC